MTLARLLARPGLAPALRLLTLGGVAIWRADWQRLQVSVLLARERGDARLSWQELVLQSILFCGFPRGITAFELLAQHWPAADGELGRGGLPLVTQAAAGRELFGAIYGNNSAAVQRMLADLHPELHDFVLGCAYGRILARPELPASSRELIAVAILAAQGQLRQFIAHARGALRLGATEDQIRECVVDAIEPDLAEAWVGRALRTGS